MRHHQIKDEKITRIWIRRRLASLLCIILWMFSLPAKADHGHQTWANAAAAVVVVNPTWPGFNKPGHGAPPGTAPAGSGVYLYIDKNGNIDPDGQLYDSGKVSGKSPFIITAAHVIDRATVIEIIDAAGNKAIATRHAIDLERDIAVLRTELIGLAIEISREMPLIGSHVCALGNSFGLGTGLSCGVVSAVNRTNIGFNAIEDFVQTDAAVNPGMSGGALVGANGRLIGLVDGIFTKDADIDAGVNFAISIPLLAASLKMMQNKGVKFDVAAD